MSGQDRADMLALRDGYEALWHRVVQRGATDSIFEIPDERVATHALLDLCNGVSQWYKSGGRLNLEEVCRMHADLALAMVRAKRAGEVLRRDGLTMPFVDEFLNLGD